jgi:hypothetical protein
MIGNDSASVVVVLARPRSGCAGAYAAAGRGAAVGGEKNQPAHRRRPSRGRGWPLAKAGKAMKHGERFARQVVGGLRAGPS